MFSFGHEGNQLDRLNNPNAISIGPEGNIFIADTGNHRICKFSKDGKLIISVGGYGWELEQFDTPLDLSAQVGLDVFVADYNNERIQRYNKRLNLISVLESEENLSDFGYPTSVALAINGDLFIADNENNRIIKFDAIRNKEERSFGGFDEGRGQIQEATRIHIQETNTIFILDKTARRILVFDYFGTYIKDIGQGVFQSPEGIALDKTFRLYVVDSNNNKLFIFNPSGKLEFIREVTHPAIGYLVDLDIYEDRLYLLDKKKSQIHVFQFNNN